MISNAACTVSAWNRATRSALDGTCKPAISAGSCVVMPKAVGGGVACDAAVGGSFKTGIWYLFTLHLRGPGTHQSGTCLYCT